MIVTLAVALALATTPKGSAKPSENKNTIKLAMTNDTMKGLMKDAMDTKADGGTAGGPDVSKLPFSADSIKQIVAHYQPQIQGCYEETMASKDKAVEGKLQTSWIITPDGIVTKAKVEKKGTTLKDSKLHDCVVAVLSAMTFPKPPDKKNHPIEFPFNLKAIK